MQKESLSLITVKTFLAVLLFAGIGTIIIGGGYIVGEYSKNKENNQTIKPVNQEAENCAREGESVGSCADCKKCCQGLQPMDYLKYNSECVNSPTSGGGVCSNCGNGICDEENNEDECNCPEDCGEIKIPDWAIYKNEKLGITLKHQNWWVESRTEKDFKSIIIEQNNTIKSTTTPGSLITVFEKSKNETIEEAIEKIIKKEGVDLGDCKILVTEQYKQEGNIIASILLKEDYEPSDDEIMAKIGNIGSLENLDVICKTTPECEWAKQILIEEKTKTKCSQYAKCFGYKCGSSFVYQPNNSEERFIYIQSMASTSSFWEWNSIEILKDQSNNTSDWQTYRNEEFGFEIRHPGYYGRLLYDFKTMKEEDYNSIHFFRNMSEEELNDFKENYLIAFEEGGTHSGTVLVKSYNNEEKLKKWYEIKLFENLEFKEFSNVDYYIANKLAKNSSSENGQLIIGYNYIIPHREIDNLFLVFEIPKFLKSKFEKGFLSTFKFIEK